MYGFSGRKFSAGLAQGLEVSLHISAANGLQFVQRDIDTLSVPEHLAVKLRAQREIIGCRFPVGLQPVGQAPHRDDRLGIGFAKRFLQGWVLDRRPDGRHVIFKIVGIASERVHAQLQPGQRHGHFEVFPDLRGGDGDIGKVGRKRRHALLNGRIVEGDIGCWIQRIRQPAEIMLGIAEGPARFFQPEKIMVQARDQVFPLVLLLWGHLIRVECHGCIPCRMQPRDLSLNARPAPVRKLSIKFVPALRNGKLGMRRQVLFNVALYKSVPRHGLGRGNRLRHGQRLTGAVVLAAARDDQHGHEQRSCCPQQLFTFDHHEDPLSGTPV